jgi:opacity protein-like surface antigen
MIPLASRPILKKLNDMQMKKLLIAAATVAVFFITSCQPEAFKEFESASAFSVAKLQGTWKVTKVTQTDEFAASKGFPFKTLDLTNLFKQNEITLTFNTNGGAPGAYTINYGTATKLLVVGNGNWLLDNVEQPQMLSLASGTDTAKMTMANYSLLANNKLMLVQRKKQSDKLVLSYIYEFSKN